MYFHRNSINKILSAGSENLFFSSDLSGQIVYWDVVKGVSLRIFSVRLTSCLDFALGKMFDSTISILAAYDDGGARLFFCKSLNYQRLLPHDFSVKKVYIFTVFLM